MKLYWGETDKVWKNESFMVLLNCSRPCVHVLWTRGVAKSFRIFLDYSVSKIVFSKILKNLRENYVLTFYFEKIFGGRQLNCRGSNVDEVGKKCLPCNVMVDIKVGIPKCRPEIPGLILETNIDDLSNFYRKKMALFSTLWCIHTK